MTAPEVEELVRLQVGDSFALENDHRITLGEALVAPQRISVIERMVRDGHVLDRVLDVWLVAQEDSDEGYRIVMSEDGVRFGLATRGFPSDPDLVFSGWYRSLKSAFLAM